MFLPRPTLNAAFHVSSWLPVTSPDKSQSQGYRHTARLNLHTKNVFEHITQSEVFKTSVGDAKVITTEYRGVQFFRL